MMRIAFASLLVLFLSVPPSVARSADEPPENAANESVSSRATSSKYYVAYRSPEGAALRSLVVPGWGQHYNGETGKGWILGSIAVVGLLLGTKVISPGVLSRGDEKHNLEKGLGWFMYGGAVAWATFDAYSRAEAINRENGYDMALSAQACGPWQFTLLRIGF